MLSLVALLVGLTIATSLTLLALLALLAVALVGLALTLADIAVTGLWIVFCTIALIDRSAAVRRLARRIAPRESWRDDRRNDPHRRSLIRWHRYRRRWLCLRWSLRRGGLCWALRRCRHRWRRRG